MIVEINITDIKIENALKAASSILKSPMSKIAKDKINEYMVSFAEMTRDDSAINKIVKEDYPEQYKLLMEVL